MSGANRSVMATLVAFLLVATAAASLWLIASAGVFASTSSRLDGPLPGAPLAAGAAAGSAEGIRLSSSFQVSQPRDPFKPLIGETTTTVPGETTTTVPGQTTTTVPGQTTTTVPGQTTTTTVSDQPQPKRVVLLEVRDEAGVKKATVTVDGQTFVVGVGDTFAGNFKVISLSDTGGVFMFGDSAFTLSVGQAILK